MSAPDGARPRVVVVGPTHPFKGGVATHTTELAHRLAASDLVGETALISWRRLYPRRLYPGEVTVPGGVPDTTPYPGTRRTLSWSSPWSWWQAGRRLAGADVVVLVHVVPFHVPALLGLLAGLRSTGSRTRVVVLAHNVLGHEPQPFDAVLVRALLRRVDGVLTHSDELARLAGRLGARRVQVAALPPFPPGGPPAVTAPTVTAPAVTRPPEPADPEAPLRLLCLGIVREYKGVDLLLDALAQVPGPVLTVAGEMWGSAGETTQRLASSPALRGRVRVQAGYVPATEVPALMARHDVLAVTYRHATGSQHPVLAHLHGMPVLATDAGTFGDQVRHGVDGLVVPAPAGPEDERRTVAALVDALRRLMRPGELDRLRSGVQPPDLDTPWREYLEALLEVARPSDQASVAGAAAPGGRALDVAKRVYERALWGRVAIQRRLLDPRRRPVPTEAVITGVLQSRAESAAALRLVRRLLLPEHWDGPKNWDALGALAAVLTLADDGSRTARVLDAGSARYSPILPWLRLYGLRDLTGINLEFSAAVRRDGVLFRYGDVTATGLPDAGLDAVTCMSVIEHGVPVVEFLTECARVLRPGGVLVLSTDFDGDPPDTTGLTAYGVPVRVFGPDDVRLLLEQASQVGLDLVEGPQHGRLGAMTHPERPVHWRRTGLDYTFILLTLRRRGPADTGR